MEIGICCIAEPWDIRKDPCWFGSWNGLAAIYWNPDACKERCFKVHEARDFVLVKCGRLHVASVYVSPTVAMEKFTGILDELGEQLQNIGGRSSSVGTLMQNPGYGGVPLLTGAVVCWRIGQLPTI